MARKKKASKTEVIFDRVLANDEHWYESPTQPGVWYPSVTTKLDAYPKDKGFEMYLANAESYAATQEKMNKAGERGTRVHKATEILDEGGSLSRENFAKDEWLMLMQFCEWHKEYNPKVIAIEQRLVSDRLRLGGTLDRVYEIDGKVVLLDIKTSNKLLDKYWCQNVLYKHMWEEDHTRPRIDETAVLRLGARTKLGYEYKTHFSMEMIEDFRKALLVTGLWDMLNEDPKPKFIDIPNILTL